MSVKSASAPRKRAAFVAAGNGNAAAATRLSTKARQPARPFGLELGVSI